MKIIVGLDDTSQYRQALRLIRRLEFPDMILVMVHVRRKADELDDWLLAQASQDANELGLRAHVYSHYGDPAEELGWFAAIEGADFVAIGCSEKGPWHAMLRGSVGRSLVAGWSGSLLIAKRDVRAEGPVDAVLGFDGNEDDRRSIERLVEWRPAGLRHVEVVSVEPPPVIADFGMARLQRGIGSISTADPENASKVARTGADLLKVAGFASSAKGVVGDVFPELERAMDTSQSEILIVPSEPHGFLYRLLLGSTSLAEAVAGRHSLLLIR